MNIVLLIVCFAASYLLGSVNTSILIYRLVAKGDIRDVGSGSAGMTNMLRTLGKRIAALVFIGDSLKAVLSILLARLLMRDATYAEYAQYIAGLGVIIGHNFPIYHGFRGGKGIVVSITTVLMTNPLLGLIVGISSIGLMFATGIVSIGSILGAFALPFVSLLMRGGSVQFGAYCVYGGMALFMHRANIGRLLRGEENSFRKKKKS